MTPQSGALNDLYRELILEHYKRPRNYGPLPEATAQSQGHNPSCGDRVGVMLRLEGQRVVAAHFTGSGCAISTASASMMTELVQGKTREEALELARAFKAMVVDGTPPSPQLGQLSALAGVHQLPARVKCATLAWNALEQALAQ
ncbi:MAG: SUF system NifU family Fe-S cluster assembly protein [Meiothermus sp.]|nr:SUF system NifU family Fe-S cluster assembly protein [Meiothermus sp.]